MIGRCATFALLSCLAGTGHDLTTTAQQIPSFLDVLPSESRMVLALKAVPGLVGYLQFSRWTMMVPVDAAFENDKDLLKYFEPSWILHLDKILQYHIVDSKELKTTDFSDGMKITTILAGETIFVAVDDDGVSFVGPSFAKSRIIDGDITTSNGIVHQVDRVFLPASLQLSLWDQVLDDDGRVHTFSTLQELIVMAELEDLFSSPSEALTMLAPPDTAFRKVDSQTMQTLRVDVGLLRSLLLHHVLQGVHPAMYLQLGQAIPTLLESTSLTVSMEITAKAQIYIDSTPLLEVDYALGSNGVLWILECVLPIPDILLGQEGDSAAMQPLPPLPPMKFPSLTPTFAPAFYPTHTPTLMPTPTPTHTPTNQPTNPPTKPPAQIRMPSPMPQESFVTHSLWSVIETQSDEFSLSAFSVAARATGWSRIFDEKVAYQHMPVTVFAPTDEAFDGAKVPLLSYSYVFHLRSILANHVAFGMWSMASKGLATLIVPVEFELRTWSGSKMGLERLQRYIFFRLDGLEGTTAARLLQNDVRARSGMLHTIDTLLMPPFMDQTLLDVAIEQTHLTTWTELIVQAGLESELASESVTALVPSDQAWSQFPNHMLDLLKSNIPSLIKVLQYHLLPDAVYPSVMIHDKMRVETSLRGSYITFEVENKTRWVVENMSKMTTMDILAGNGIVHVLDKVLLPPMLAPLPEDLEPSSLPTRSPQAASPIASPPPTFEESLAKLAPTMAPSALPPRSPAPTFAMKTGGDPPSGESESTTDRNEEKEKPESRSSRRGKKSKSKPTARKRKL